MKINQTVSALIEVQNGKELSSAIYDALTEVDRDIIDALRDEGPLTRNELVDRTQATYNSIGWYLTRLMDNGLVEKRGSKHQLSEVWM